MATISGNLQAARARVRRAARAAGRDAAQVIVLAASKAHPPERLREACAAWQRVFGENYVQEAMEKMDALADLQSLALEWHMIGPLQGNKARLAAERFGWVQTVDRERIARRLSDARPPELPPLNVLIQVNVSGEASKSGAAPRDVPALARATAALPRLKLRGLMAIPEPGGDVAQQRARFRAVRELYDVLCAEGLALDTLSMGMSDDLEAAVAEGSTMVRIGTAIFGPREQRAASPAHAAIA
ncbi:MAG: YggS family pyridoxal phosphate-dependent enzyme [Betaproteobacteria bacterium]|nr:YggS family pyridoxal phosphate-dependent enzyme [Betaproteobacteria bacterium]